MEVEELFRRAGKYLTVRRAYGPSYSHDGVLMVPVAVVAGGAGGGNGGFPVDAVGSDAMHTPEDGGGGGFGGFVYPVGVYVVRNGNVRFRPTVDFPFVAMWSLLVLRLAFKVLRYLRDS